MCQVPEQFLQFNLNLHSFLYNDYKYFAWFAILESDRDPPMFRKMLLWKGLRYYATTKHDRFQQTRDNYVDNDLENYPLVTRVSLNHLRDPKRWPLFDINVWKATRRMNEEIIKRRILDRALWEYGRIPQPN